MSDTVLSTYSISQHPLKLSTIILMGFSDSILPSLKKNKLKLKVKVLVTQ